VNLERLERNAERSAGVPHP